MSGARPLLFVIAATFAACGGSQRSHPSDALSAPRVHGITAGRAHTCARHEGGTVSCWGEGMEGQLGDGERFSRSRPVRVVGLDRVEEIAAGGAHTCARTSDGHVWCWGARRRGQIGDGAAAGVEPAVVPTLVAGIDDATQIAAGEAHSCAVRSDARVWCWGDDLHGQLGRGGDGGPEALSADPVLVPRLIDVVEVRAGGSHTCARTRAGLVSCWGAGVYPRVPGVEDDIEFLSSPGLVEGLTDVVELSLGYNHTCARRANGFVACWGGGVHGQLGNGDNRDRSLPTELPWLGEVLEIDAGGQHTCVRLATSEVRCWGRNDRGQLGDGTFVEHMTPSIDVAVLPLQVAAGGAHTCALDDHGAVHCWGSNLAGQLGDGQRMVRNERAYVPGVIGADALRAGGDRTCARIAHSWRCWGDAAFAPLGDGATRSTAALAVVDWDLDIVAPGRGRACGIEDGELSCWARASSTHVPEAVAVGTHARDVAVGASFACELRDTGQVLCWGRGAHGALGRGTIASDESPSPARGIHDATSVVVGSAHACALLATGHVRCWGAGRDGELGDGASVDRLSPVEVSGLTDARGIALGLAHTCAWLADGEVSCWGRGSDGQLGNGARGAVASPQRIAGLTDVVALAAGASHTCGLSSDGRVECWGANLWGQVGVAESDEDCLGPVRIEGLTAQAIAAGNTHTCALAQGRPVCWGSDVSGQLGDGEEIRSSHAVRVLFDGAGAAAIGDVSP